MSGIVNLGSTCYISSAIQLLYSIEQFRELVLVGQPTTKVAIQMKKIFNDLSNKKTVNVQPLTKLLGLSMAQCRTEHRDVQQFLLELLDTLTSDNSFATIIELVFGGSLQRENTASMEPFLGKLVPS